MKCTPCTLEIMPLISGSIIADLVAFFFKVKDRNRSKRHLGSKLFSFSLLTAPFCDAYEIILSVIMALTLH